MRQPALWMLMGLAACGASALHAQTPAPPGTIAAEKPDNPETVGGSGSQAVAPLVPVPPQVAPAAPAASAAPAAVAGAVPAAANVGPITRPQVRQGDQWIYRRVVGNASVLLRQRVTDLNEIGISLLTESTGTFDVTTTVYDRQWGLLGSGFNTYAPALAYYSFPLYVGKRWRINSSVNNFGAGQTGQMTGEGAALGFEMVETAAGQFVALKVQVEIETTDPGDAARAIRVRETHWYARDVLRAVKVESTTQVANEAPRQETIELVDFKFD